MRKDTNIIPGVIGIIFIIMLITCSSCSDGTGSDKQNGSIVGKWQMVTIKMYDTQVGDLTIAAEQFLEMSGTGATKSILQFNEDGSGSVTTTYSDSSQDTIPGTWISDGDNLTVEGAGIDDTVLYDVDGDKMTLTRIMAISLAPQAPPEDIEIDMIYNRIE